MRPAENIKRLIENLADKTSIQMDQQVRQDMLHALAESEKPSAVAWPNLGRTIMRSPITKLAAAAAIIIACTTALFFWRSTGSGIALADASTAFDQARVIHVEGWQYFPWNKLSDGTSIRPVDIEWWLDLEKGRMRQTQATIAQSMSMSSTDVADCNTVVTEIETVCDGSYLMTLNHTAKTAAFTRVSDYSRQLMTYRQSRLLWGQLCGRPAQLEHFVKMGRDDIDGNSYDIWQLEAGGGMGNVVGGAGAGGRGWSTGNGSGQGHVAMAIPSLQSKLWISPNSGRLGRAQVLSKIGDGHWRLGQDYYTIDYDVQIPESTFTTELPAGYTATNSKETAPVMELPRATVRYGSLECSVVASFTLSDGSVIVAWQGCDDEDQGSQEPLFANLTFGGPLPKLPIEIYSLKAVGTSERAAYTARHLGHTSKADQLIEWTLYVPKITPPDNVKYLGYEALWRFNTTTQPSGQIGMTVGYGVPIKTPEDFDKWVRGAMVELSDSATAPDQVTYQSVSKLIQ